MNQPLMYEPIDPPDLPTIAVDREDFDRVTEHYHLDIERSADEQRVYVVCEDIVFYAPSLDAAS